VDGDDVFFFFLLFSPGSGCLYWGLCLYVRFSFYSVCFLWKRYPLVEERYGRDMESLTGVGWRMEDPPTGDLSFCGEVFLG